MATTNSPIHVAPKTRQWLRAGLWLLALAAMFVAFAQFATGSELLWNDSTLLVATGILSVALFIALSRARAQGIDARRTFLNSVMTLLWFVLISELVSRSQCQLHLRRVQGQFRRRSVPGSRRLAACRFCSAPFDDCSPAIFAPNVCGFLQWVTLFTLLAVASIPLSPSPSYSLAWAFKLVLTVLLLRAFLSSMESNEDVLTLFYTLLFGMVIIIVLRLVLAMNAPEPFFQGGRLNDYASPTGLSTLAAVLSLLSMTLLAIRRRGWLLFPLAFGLIVILLSGGKTGIVAGVLSALLFFALQKQVRNALGLLVIFLVISGILLVTTPLGKYFQDYSQSGEASTITGRTDLWTTIWPAVLDKPIVGHGYVASRFLSIDLDLDLGAGWEPPHTHNSFLEPLYNNGIFGLLLVVILNYIMIRNFVRVLKRPADRESFF